jgi:putative hydrolase of HD superfamily
VTISERLQEQLGFLVEVDKLKQVERETSIIGASRRENSAEHSWHIALMALVLGEYAAGEVDLGRVVAMLLLHDVVEIDAGDVFAYDEAGQAGRVEREYEAARRIYKLLPGDQGTTLLRLWREFEERATPEARFAAALDRLQPLLLNVANEGDVWRRHGITADRVYQRNASIEEGAPQLWRAALEIIETAVGAEILAMPPEPAPPDGRPGRRSAAPVAGGPSR